MRNENDRLIHGGADNVFDLRPLAVSDLPDENNEHAPKHPRTKHTYAVEVCWPRLGRITCRTNLVCAQSDEDAAAKGRAKARRQVAHRIRLEVVDLALMKWLKTFFATEGVR